MEVPVVLEGHAEGVKAGGKLNLQMRKLEGKSPFTQQFLRNCLSMSITWD